MLLLRRLAIYFFSLAALFCFYLILIKSGDIFYWALSLVVILALVHILVVGSYKAKKGSLIFLSQSVFFVGTSVSFLILLENYNLKIFLIFSIALALFFYWLLLLNFFHWPNEYQPFSLADFGHYLLLISWFFLNTAVFALIIFLNLSFWLAALLLVFLFLIIQAWEFWLQKKSIQNVWRFLLTGSVIFLELAIVLSVLPTSYFVKGFLAVLSAYLWLDLISLERGQNWSQKVFFKKVIFSLFMIIIVLSTSRWF